MTLATLERAKESILLFAYSVTDIHIVEMLEKKAKEGVSVTLLHDKNAFTYAHRPIDPSVKMKVVPSKGLMHLKIAVVDKEFVIFGSANFTTEGMTKDRNLMNLLKCKELAQEIHVKAQEILNGEPSSTLAIHTLFVGKNRTMEFHLLPESGKESEQRFLNFISTAQKTLQLAIFTWTHEGLARRVIDLHKKKVDVLAIIDGNQAKGTGKKICRMLQEEGVPLLIAKPNHFLLTHHKFARVDDKVAHGSLNWTDTAFKKNNDCVAFFEKLTKEDLQSFDEMWIALVDAVKSTHTKHEK